MPNISRPHRRALTGRLGASRPLSHHSASCKYAPSLLASTAWGGKGRFGISDVCVLSCEQDGHAQLTLVGVKVDVAVILDGQANLVDVLGCKLIFAHALK